MNEVAIQDAFVGIIAFKPQKEALKRVQASYLYLVV
jgi:hypothetical protein